MSRLRTFRWAQQRNNIKSKPIDLQIDARSISIKIMRWFDQSSNGATFLSMLYAFGQITFVATTHEHVSIILSMLNWNAACLVFKTIIACSKCEHIYILHMICNDGVNRHEKSSTIQIISVDGKAWKLVD